MTTWPIIAIIIGILLAVGLVFAVRAWMDQQANVVDTGVSTDEEARAESGKAVTWVSVGLALLVVAGLAAYMFWRRGGGDGGDDDTSVAVFVPVWLAAMIPILAAKKKKRQFDHNQKKWMIVLVVGVLLAVAITILIVELNIFGKV